MTKTQLIHLWAQIFLMNKDPIRRPRKIWQYRTILKKFLNIALYVNSIGINEIEMRIAEKLHLPSPLN